MPTLSVTERKILMLFVGVDTGGTFTDFVLFDGSQIKTHKELSTPDQPERAIIRGLVSLGVADLSKRLVHGSTVATNAVLEGNMASTVYVTNKGFADVLNIGRQARKELYNLTPSPRIKIVDSAHCLEIEGRITAEGDILQPLRDSDLERLVEQVVELSPQAVAINLLFSFLDPSLEKRIASALPKSLEISCSHEVLPEYREFERGIATFLNAALAPVMRRYLQSLNKTLSSTILTIMQSSAVTCDVSFASSNPINLLLSGPAGGLLGAKHVANAVGLDRLLTFDMGGTSTDVALIDGTIALSADQLIGDYPVSVPMVELHTIGAGGGSIAWVDEGGLLRVGPRSAGAKPGPACYGTGGHDFTVTDANLVLGYLPDGLCLGEICLDRRKSLRALETLVKSFPGSDSIDVASGVLRVTNELMQQALRVISIAKGFDPRDFTLVSYGGAGGLHVCALAEHLDIPSALVPAHAGVLSALGMICARPGRKASHSFRRELSTVSETEISNTFDSIIAKCSESLQKESIPVATLTESRSVDLCYRGQSSSLNIPWQPNVDLERLFGIAHETRYGHCLELPVELVNVRVSVEASGMIGDFSRNIKAGPRTVSHSDVSYRYPIISRQDLLVNEMRNGPVVIIDEVGTTFIAPGWQVTLDGTYNLYISRN